jgi:hypothetical protein
LQGRDCPRYGYTVWTGDREVIESVILKDLHLEKTERTIKPLFEGTWE